MFEYGAQWLRIDFHLHTRTDSLKRFVYSGEDNSFISDYVETLKQKGIAIAAITNHNTFNLGEFKALRKKSLKNDIYLLPGVELSVNDGRNGIHVLIIFNDAWLETYNDGNDFINVFLNAAFDAKDRKGRCNLNLIKVFEKLEDIARNSYFEENKKDFFVIFAHVEENHGLWEEISDGRLGELWKNELLKKYTLGFQKVRTRDKANRKRQLLGEAYPAEVEGSDPASLEEIGRNCCWIMIGDFNFQAIKYALRNSLDRISLKSDMPLYTHPFIKKVVFEGGIFDGMTLNFSPELNTLIGIRGSGKSAILESIRYALNIPLDENAQDQEYKKNLVNYTLGSGGAITIFVSDKENEYEIRRINGEHPIVYINGFLQPVNSILSTVFNGLVYFGQKDLSFTVDGFEKSLIEKLLGDKLTDIREHIEQQKQKVIKLIGQLTDLSSLEDKKREYENQRQVVEAHLDSYKKYGVEMKLQRRIEFDSDIEKGTQIISFVNSYLEAFALFISQYEDELKNYQVTSVSEQNTYFFDEFFTCYRQLIDSFDRLKGEYTRDICVLKELKEKIEQLLHLRDELSEEFASIERKIETDLQLSGGKRINLEEFRRLRSDSYKFSQALEIINKMENNARNISEKLSLELNKLRDLWHQEFLIINDELNKINKTQIALKIEVQYEGDKEKFINFMKSVFQGSGLRETFFENLANHFSDFIEMRQESNLLDGELGKNKEKFYKYFSDNQVALLTYQVPNSFIIKYKDRTLREHSLGQRASALILFILSQNQNSVFIIDQPEDDLDNKTIYEDVIKQILKIKPQAQFIFATHNPNFPVLGDAEQIFSCHYNDQAEIVSTGSIDSPKIQNEIIEIMEGGLEAFRLREGKYNTWKLMNS